MAAVPTEVLSRLAAMDEYTRLLAADQLARDHGIQMESLLQMVDDHGSGAEHTDGVEQAASTLPAAPDLDAMTASHVRFDEQGPAKAQQIQDAHRYRMRYNPSEDAQKRVEEITDAIICPHCNAPLGIPNIRPIKVNCPNCSMESTFLA